MNWILKSFDDLSVAELYALLQLRAEVFVVEQNCAYLDLDNKDQKSFHLLGYENETLVAYTRLLPAGVSFAEASIGRVVTSPKARKNGVGKELMQRSIESIYQLFGNLPVRIGAQLYLERFYTLMGFERVSDIYLEDGIEHIEMLKSSE